MVKGVAACDISEMCNLSSVCFTTTAMEIRSIVLEVPEGSEGPQVWKSKALMGTMPPAKVELTDLEGI